MQKVKSEEPKVQKGSNRDSLKKGLAKKTTLDQLKFSHKYTK